MRDEFKDFISDAKSEHCYTEDMPRLLKKEWHYVFVYNHRRGKHSNYLRYEDGAEFISFAWTKSCIYEILKVDTERKTFCLASLLGTEQLLGELWLISTETLLDLDADEANLLVTNRIEVSIELPNGQTIGAWIYIGNSRWLHQRESKITKYTGCTYVGSRRFLEVHA